MSRNKNSILAVAVIGALYATGASAQFNLTTSTTPLTYAQELTKPATILEAVGQNQLSFNLGYNFSDNEVRYARVQCSSNLTFLTPEIDATSSANAVYGSLNNSGSAVFFSVTDPVDGNSTAVANTTVVLGSSTGNIYTITDNNPVTCSYSLYDQPSQAQAGGTAGRIVSIADKVFINSAPSYTFTTANGTATVDVEAANGAYFGFLGADRSIGSFTIAMATAPALIRDYDGTAITAADLFNTPTNVLIAGDMTGLANTSGIDAADTCGATTAFNTFAASNASATTGANTFTRFVCFTATGLAAISAGDYSATFRPSANPGYTLSNSSVLPIGSILRNGTQLQAPLVQTPNGYISRIALTNTNATTARTFSWTFRPASGGSASEANTNYTGATSGTGSIPANGSTVISLVDVLGTAATNFNGTPPRGTFTVNVNAPNNQIQGLYQIVNPTAGSISNHVMVRPGTN